MILILDDLIFTQLGFGIISAQDVNPQLRLRRTNGNDYKMIKKYKNIFVDLVLTSKKDCVAFNSVWDGLGWTWNEDWYGCYKSKSQDGAMAGDSGRG